MRSLVFLFVLGVSVDGCVPATEADSKELRPTGSSSCEPELSSDERRTDCSDYMDSSFELERSIEAGERFTYSIAVLTSASSTIELFAETETCGEESAFLGRMEVSDGVACFELEAPLRFDRVRARISGSGFNANQRICAAATCPASEPSED